MSTVGWLTVELLSGVDLASKGLTTSPYILVQLDYYKKSTKPGKDKKFPKFEEAFEFEILDKYLKYKLQFILKCKSKSNDAEAGRAEVPVQDILNELGSNKFNRLNLTDRETNKPAGELLVKFSFMTEAQREQMINNFDNGDAPVDQQQQQQQQQQQGYQSNVPQQSYQSRPNNLPGSLPPNAYSNNSLPRPAYPTTTSSHSSLSRPNYQSSPNNSQHNSMSRPSNPNLGYPQAASPPNLSFMNRPQPRPQQQQPVSPRPQYPPQQQQQAPRPQYPPQQEQRPQYPSQQQRPQHPPRQEYQQQPRPSYPPEHGQQRQFEQRPQQPQFDQYAPQQQQQRPQYDQQRPASQYPQEFPPAQSYPPPQRPQEQRTQYPPQYPQYPTSPQPQTQYPPSSQYQPDPYTRPPKVQHQAYPPYEEYPPHQPQQLYPGPPQRPSSFHSPSSHESQGYPQPPKSPNQYFEQNYDGRTPRPRPPPGSPMLDPNNPYYSTMQQEYPQYAQQQYPTGSYPPQTTPNDLLHNFANSGPSGSSRPPSLPPRKSSGNLSLNNEDAPAFYVNGQRN